MHSLLDPTHLLSSFGYIGLISIIFAECGLPFGFFFPGDSLLISAGILASQGHLNIGYVIIFSLIAAIIGYSCGYYIGAKLGTRLFERPNVRFLTHKRIAAAHVFFEKYGIQSIILARFVPFARTFAPIIAGTSDMSYRKFMLYNVIGGILWTTIVPLLGFSLGRAVPHIDRYLLPAIVFIVVASTVLPLAWHLLRKKVAKS